MNKKDENITSNACSPSSCSSSWRNPKDDDILRRGMLSLLRKILFSKKKEAVMKEMIMKDKTYEEQNKYKASLLEKLEYHLYLSASSLEDYANVGTLCMRIRAIAIKAIEEESSS